MVGYAHPGRAVTSEPDHGGAQAPEAWIEAFVADVRRMFGAMAVAVSDLSGRIVAIDGDVGFDSRRLLLERAAAPGTVRSPVPTSSGPGGRAVASLPVVLDGGRVGSMHVVGPPGWRIDRRSSAAMRVAADVADVYFEALAGLRVVVTEDRLVLRLGQALTEAALEADEHALVVGATGAALAILLGAPSLGIAVTNEQGDPQALPGSFGAPDEVVAASFLHRAAAKDAFRAGMPQLINDPAREIPDVAQWVDAFGIQRLMTVPMGIDGRAIGVINIANKPVDFTAADASRAARVAPFVAAAVEHVTRRIDLGHREAMAAVVSRAATSAASGEHLSRFSATLDDLRGVLGACRAAFYLADGSRVAEVGQWIDDPLRVGLFRATASHPAATTRSPIAHPRALGETGWAELHTPVVVDGQTRATLSFLRVPCVPFSEHERGIVGRLANILALAWTTTRYERERAEAAQLHERTAIAHELHDEVARILAEGRTALQAVAEDPDADAEARSAVERAREILVQSETSIKNLDRRLEGAGADEPDVVRAVEVAARAVSAQFGVTIEVSPSGGEPPMTVPARLRTALLEAVREAMVNAAKYAGTAPIRVTVGVRRQRLVFEIIDDGTGMASSAAGYGLRAARRRVGDVGGSMRMYTGQHGTRVVVSAALDVGAGAAPTVPA